MRSRDCGRGRRSVCKGAEDGGGECQESLCRGYGGTELIAGALMDRSRKSVSRHRSSGLLVNATPAQGGETQVLCEVLRKLTAVTRAISVNLQNVNTNLERILMDKEDIEELERMLNSLKVQ